VRRFVSSRGTAVAVTDTYQFDAFGMPIVSTGTTANNFRYSGEWLDPNLSFYNLRARYYNQATGRFETMDPYQGSIIDPATLHKYVYTKNNPVNAVDPSGRDAFIESLFTTTDIRTPLEVNAEMAARSVAEVVCSAARFLAALMQPLPPGAPGRKMAPGQ
jgi:RHS repeat-associated protein